MAQLSSWRSLTALAAATSLTLAVAVAVASPAAGASNRTHRAESHGALVRLEKSKKYGEILTDGAGRTLYVLTSGGAKSLKCTGACASIWPPLLTKGKPRAGKGVVAKRLRTVKRGSSLQVVYDGHPLYFYAADSGPGQENGEGIKSFGGTWYVLSGKGLPVKGALASSTSSSGGSRVSGGW
jgi:predicted lipoprotein with Yx(FWY)xxD motif